jgi:hypothetical protein
MSKTIIVLSVSNATDDQIQTDLGKAFTEFCEKNKGTGITAEVLTDSAGREVLDLINEN